MPQNKQIHLVSRPATEATVENFELLVSDTPTLQDDQVLVRHHFLSLDPYMRGRMNDSKSYAVPQALNQTMGGGTVGEVIESKNSKFSVGDKVVGMGGWQQYSVVDANQIGALRKVDTTHIPLSAYLGAVGMPGVTAWYGLVKIIEPMLVRRCWLAQQPVRLAALSQPCQKPADAEPLALPAARINASMRWMNWALTPVLITSCTKIHRPSPRPSRTLAQMVLMVTSRMLVAWCSMRCCRE